MDDDWFKDKELWRNFRSILFHSGRVEQTEIQVDRFIDILNLKKGDKILDQCCGIGRHSLEFARRGYEVTGIDLTMAYLKEAESKAEKEGLDVEFVQADMREFERENTYDAAINFFTSFGYFKDKDDNLKVLKKVHSSLKPGGRFLIDVMGKEVMAKVYKPRDWVRIDDGFFLEEREIVGNWDAMESKWILIKDGQVKERPYYTKLYSGEEMKDMLWRAGFGRVDIYGGLDLSEYDEDAERLVAVAKK